MTALLQSTSGGLWEAASGVLLTTLRQVLFVAGPIALLAFGLRWVEQALSTRMLQRLGWPGIWLTGWLGVPVHELSHAGACVLFRHRLRSVRLFAPDRRTGQLGGVEHAFDRRSIYQQIGRFFIGIAPLVGGVAALWLLTLWLGPGSATLAPLQAEATPLGGLRAGMDQAAKLIASLIRPESLGQPLTWAYLYLCLCIAAHMAPSRADLDGGWPGFLVLLIVLLVVNAIVSWVGGDPAPAERIALSASAPLGALLVVALVLLASLLGLITLITAPLPRRAT